MIFSKTSNRSKTNWNIVHINATWGSNFKSINHRWRIFNPCRLCLYLKTKKKPKRSTTFFFELIDFLIPYMHRGGKISTIDYSILFYILFLLLLLLMYNRGLWGFYFLFHFFVKAASIKSIYTWNNFFYVLFPVHSKRGLCMFRQILNLIDLLYIEND